MKKLLVLATCGWLAVVGLAAESFLQQLSPEERHAAGLDALTPGQQQALDGLAERYAKEGARVTEVKVREETEAKVREETKVEVAKAHEEAKVEVAKVREAAKAEAATELKQKETAKVGLPDPEKENQVIKSRISGTFKGWSGRTLFRLENGQQWVQTDDQFYVVSSRPGPEVEIQHSSMGGWKLWVQPDGRWVRVKRVN
jgi:hypothetical protein